MLTFLPIPNRKISIARSGFETAGSLQAALRVTRKRQIIREQPEWPIRPARRPKMLINRSDLNRSSRNLRPAVPIRPLTRSANPFWKVHMLRVRNFGAALAPSPYGQAPTQTTATKRPTTSGSGHVSQVVFFGLRFANLLCKRIVN